MSLQHRSTLIASHSLLPGNIPALPLVLEILHQCTLAHALTKHGKEPRRVDGFWRAFRFTQRHTPEWIAWLRYRRLCIARTRRINLWLIQQIADEPA